MTPAFKDWLKDNTGLPGVLAAAVRGADGKPLAFQGHVPEFTAEKMSEVWRSVAEILQLLKKQHQPDRRLGWTFDSARLYVSVRPDGASLALFTRLNEPSSDEMERLLAEFEEISA